jgi:hypothetical protein
MMRHGPACNFKLPCRQTQGDSETAFPRAGARRPAHQACEMDLLGQSETLGS